jgi:hypothetical protein
MTCRAQWHYFLDSTKVGRAAHGANRNSFFVGAQSGVIQPHERRVSVSIDAELEVGHSEVSRKKYQRWER